MKLRVRLLPFGELEASLLAQWSELESLAIEPSLSHAPDFVLPAVRWLTPDQLPLALTVDSPGKGGSPTLLGLALLTPCRGTTFLPIPHLRLYRTSHTFTGGLLVARSVADLVLSEMVGFFAARATPWHALELVNIPAERFLFEHLRSSFGQYRVTWHEVYRFRRPIIDLSVSSDPLGGVSKAVIKDSRRRERRLAELGTVEKRVLQGNEITRETIATHLHLECMGWKATEGTSMGSSYEGKRFFEEMATKFASRKRAIFSEVLFDGDVIASSSNFQSGSELFAFKIGWNPGYAHSSPGRMSELYLMGHLATRACGVERVDSGAEANSYLGALWPQSAWIARGYFALSSLGRITLGSMAPSWRLRKQASAISIRMHRSRRSSSIDNQGGR